MRKRTQFAMATAVMAAVLVLLLHPATPGVTAPVDAKQLKQIQSVLLMVAAVISFLVCATEIRLQLLEAHNAQWERSPERTVFCSLLC